MEGAERFEGPAGERSWAHGLAPTAAVGDGSAVDPRIYEGQRVDAYVLERFLGAGSFGMVFSARKATRAGHVRALKLIRPSSADDRDSVLAAWRTEWQRLEAVSGPNIVGYYDADVVETLGPFEGWAYILTERCETSLHDVLKTSPRHRLDDEDARRLVDHMLAALIALRTAPTGESVHRDLKPRNILRKGDVWKLCDFGTARFAPELRGEDGHTEVIGTVHYLSRAAIRGHQDHAADLYALGATVHEALTGEVLHPRNSPGPASGGTLGTPTFTQLVLTTDPTIAAHLPDVWRTIIGALIGQYGRLTASDIQSWLASFDWTTPMPHGDEGLTSRLPPQPSDPVPPPTAPADPDPPRAPRTPRPRPAWPTLRPLGSAPSHAVGVLRRPWTFQLAAVALVGAAVAELVSGRRAGSQFLSGFTFAGSPLVVGDVVLTSRSAAVYAGLCVTAAVIALARVGWARAWSAFAALAAAWAIIDIVASERVNLTETAGLQRVALGLYASSVVATLVSAFRHR